jgi:DNA repair protein RadC
LQQLERYSGAKRDASAEECAVRAEVRSRPVRSNWQALIAYVQTAMAYEQIEQFRILFLDRKNNLIADEVQQRRTVNHTPVITKDNFLMLPENALPSIYYRVCCVRRHTSRRSGDRGSGRDIRVKQAVRVPNHYSLTVADA